MVAFLFDQIEILLFFIKRKICLHDLNSLPKRTPLLVVQFSPKVKELKKRKKEEKLFPQGFSRCYYNKYLTLNLERLPSI